MDFSERLRGLMRTKGITQLQLGKAIRSSQSNISRLLRGGQDPRASDLHAISKTLGVSMEWLLTGKYQETDDHGSESINDRSSSSEYLGVVARLHALLNTADETVTEMKTEFLHLIPDPELDDEEPTLTVDVIHYLGVLGGVAAGEPISAVDEMQIVVSIDYAALDDGHYALQVCGKSMEPDIPDGAYVVVKRLDGKIPKKGSVVVFADAYGASLKRLGYRKSPESENANAMGQVPVLESINPAYSEVVALESGAVQAVLVEVLPSEDGD